MKMSREEIQELMDEYLDLCKKQLEIQKIKTIRLFEKIDILMRRGENESKKMSKKIMKMIKEL